MGTCAKPEHAVQRELGVIDLIPARRVEVLGCGCALVWPEGTTPCTIVHPGVTPATLEQIVSCLGNGMSWREGRLLECGCTQTKIGGILIDAKTYHNLQEKCP